MTVFSVDAKGNVTCKGLFPEDELGIPTGAVSNDGVAGDADMRATKMRHQFPVPYSQADGSAIVAATVPIHTVYGSTAEIVAIDVACVDAPSGGDLAFSVDLQKADVVTPAPATVLSAPIAYSSTQTDMEVEPGVVTSSALTDGDSLLVVVAVSGSTGTQGQGLIVTVWLREKPAP